MIPLKDRINALRQLGAAGLIYAAGIDPGILDSMLSRLATYYLDLAKPFLGFRLSTVRFGDVLEPNLFLLPSVRKDGISGNSRSIEVLEPKRSGVEEPHPASKLRRMFEKCLSELGMNGYNTCVAETATWMLYSKT